MNFFSNNSIFSNNKALTAEAHLDINNTININSNSNTNCQSQENNNEIKHDTLLNYYTSITTIRKDLDTDPKYLSYNLSYLRKILWRLKPETLEKYYLELNYDTQKIERFFIYFKDIWSILNERKDLSLNKRIKLAFIKSKYKQNDLIEKINYFHKRHIRIDEFLYKLGNNLNFLEKEFNKKKFKLKIIKLYKIKN